MHDVVGFGEVEIVRCASDPIGLQLQPVIVEVIIGARTYLVRTRLYVFDERWVRSGRGIRTRQSGDELEGALRKILAYSRFSHKEINIGLAREALKDLLSIQNRQVGVENIQKTVADFYKIKVADMYSKKRPASIARPRQIAMYLAKELTQKSLPEIGELFGGRDHTTVLHAVRKIGGERQQLTELNQQLHVLEQTLKG